MEVVNLEEQSKHVTEVSDLQYQLMSGLHWTLMELDTNEPREGVQKDWQCKYDRYSTVYLDMSSLL